MATSPISKNRKSSGKEELAKKVRNVSYRKTYQAHEEPIFWSGQILKRVNNSIDGHLTVQGVYAEVLNEIQNQRKWAIDTCTSYDRIVKKFLLPEFEGVLFESLTPEYVEEVFLRLCRTINSTDNRRTACRLLRLLLETAAAHGYKKIAFAVPEEHKSEAPAQQPVPVAVSESTPENPLSDIFIDDESKAKETEAESKLGKDEADKRLRNPRSLPLAKTVHICILCINGLEQNGTCFAGLFVFVFGTRPSEALGFTFADYQLIDDVWCLIRHQVTYKDSREIGQGGKTINSYRYLPVPKFLKELLDARKNKLLTMYSSDEVAAMPIACSGSDYAKASNTAELNSCLGGVFRSCNVSKQTMDYAQNEIKNSSISTECEKSPTAYLGRHQFATDCLAAGMSMEMLQMVMGHDIEDSILIRSDQSNPDILRVLSRKMDERPLIQILNREAEQLKFQYTDGTQKFLGDNLHIEFPDEPGTYEVAISAVEANELPQILTNDLEIKFRKTRLRNDPSQSNARSDVSLSITNRSYLLSDAQRSALLAGNFDVPEIFPAISDPEWLKSVAEKMPKLPVPLSEILPGSSQIINVALNPPAQKSLPSRVPQQQKDLGLAEMKNLYALIYRDKRKDPIAIPLQPANGKITLCNKMGNKIADKPTNTIRFIKYDPDCWAYVITPDGYVIPIPPQANTGHGIPQEMVDYLANGAYYIQFPQKVADGDAVVCLTSDGNIQLTSAQAFTKCKKRVLLVSGLSTQATIVSACYLPSCQDLMLATRNGKMLLIRYEGLVTKSSLGSKPIQGISKDAGIPALCAPRPTGEIMGVSDRGKVYRLNAATSKALYTHGRGGEGVQLFCLEDDESLISLSAVPKVLTVMSARGYLVCVSTDNINGKGRGTTGSKVLKAGNKACGAIGTVFA